MNSDYDFCGCTPLALANIASNKSLEESYRLAAIEEMRRRLTGGPPMNGNDPDLIISPTPACRRVYAEALEHAREAVDRAYERSPTGYDERMERVINELSSVITSANFEIDSPLED